jgi:shikimate kinase
LKQRSGKTVGAKGRHRVQSQLPREHRLSGNAVFLVGFMGAGKTSVGRALGQQLNWLFEDLDDRIERCEGRTVPDIFRDSGESEFRRAEHAALQGLLEEVRRGASVVVALGGGTFAQDQNHNAIQASGIWTVFLDAPLPELWNRCTNQAESGTKRPLQTSKSKFRETYNARLEYYRTASQKVETAGKEVEAIAAEIARTLGLKKIEIRTQQGEVE